VHRDLDDLPPSGALALEQGRRDRREQVDPAGEVDERGAGLVGGPSGSPVAAAAPDIACTVMSMADMWAYGPVVP
jgi:hypothetical protein